MQVFTVSTWLKTSHFICNLFCCKLSFKSIFICDLFCSTDCCQPGLVLARQTSPSWADARALPLILKSNSSIVFWKSQMTCRGSNLDSNLNSAAWQMLSLVLHLWVLPCSRQDLLFQKVCLDHNIPDQEVIINSLLSHGKWQATDTIVIIRIDFRHDHCKWKNIGKVDGSQNAHREVFSSNLANHGILLQSGARWQVWGAEWSHLHKHWFLNKCLV